jgi:hypothetical protein
LSPNQESLRAAKSPIAQRANAMTTKTPEEIEGLMSSAYWRLVRLDGTGRHWVEEVAIAQAVFQEHFADQPNVSDASIQRQLLQLMRDPSVSLAIRQLAQWCLRCFISQQTEKACMQLERQFGTRHGFTRYNLFPFVLDDDLRAFPFLSDEPDSTQYQPLAGEILRTVDISQSTLSTWTTRQVRHHPELRRFLQENGVFLATDWGILNDTSPDLLKTVLTDFYVLSAAEVTSAYHLLQAYHQVYCHDRFQQRKLGHLKGRAVCTAPSSEQLTRMVGYLQEQGLLPPRSSERILSQLQTIASQLRQYRLHRANGTLPTDLLNKADTSEIADKVGTVDPEIDPEADDFLRFYRGQILSCLDQALAQVTHDRFTYLKRKKTATDAEHFLTALKLFHCQGQSMSEIAPQVELEKQYQVTRLLKLKNFRDNVRSRLLRQLLGLVQDKAKTYTDDLDPLRLQKLNQQIETILEEHIGVILQRAESEAANARQREMTSLFARRLCEHLDHLSD